MIHNIEDFQSECPTGGNIILRKENWKAWSEQCQAKVKETWAILITKYTRENYAAFDIFCFRKVCIFIDFLLLRRIQRSVESSQVGINLCEHKLSKSPPG